MGLFKKIGNALGIKNHTFVGKILNTDISNENNSTPTPSAVQLSKNLKDVTNVAIENLMSEAKVSQSVTGASLKEIVKKDKSFIGDLLSDMWDGLKGGINSGLKNAGQAGIDKLTGKLINTDGVQGSQDAISTYANGILETTLAKYLKRNWFYILFPVLGLMVFAKFLFNGKKTYKRKR